MIEFRKIVTQPNYQMNYIKPRLITALTKSAIEKTTREKKTNNKKAKTKISWQKLNIKI